MSAPDQDAAVSRLLNEEVADSVLDLSVGEPDQPMPAALVDVATRALTEGRTGYTPKLGLASLREQVARDAGVDSADVAITVGGSEAVAVAIAVALRAGDTLVVPDPAWPNYRVFASSLGIRVVTYAQGADADSFFDLDEIATHLEAGAAMVVVNSPSNPMATVASADALDALVALVRGHGATILSDEAYEGIVFDGGHAPSPWNSPGGAEVTFQCRTFSKTYSMTGMRVGTLVSPSRYRLQVAAVHGTMVGCAPRVAQETALVALQRMGDRAQAVAATYRHRFALALDMLGQWMRTDVVGGHGGFYVWLDGGDDRTAQQLTDQIEARGVRVSSGNAYTVSESHAVRLALTADNHELTAAMSTIRDVLSRVSGPG